MQFPLFTDSDQAREEGVRGLGDIDNDMLADADDVSDLCFVTKAEPPSDSCFVILLVFRKETLSVLLRGRFENERRWNEGRGRFSTEGSLAHSASRSFRSCLSRCVLVSFRILTFLSCFLG